MAEYAVDASVRNVPRRQGIRYVPIVLISLLFLTACGGESTDSSDLPPIPPTMTIEPEATTTAAPEPPIEPTPTPEGEALQALDGGQEIAADDGRYTLRVPQYWVQNTAPPADIAFRESGGTPSDDGFTYRVSREPLSQSIEDVQDFARSQEEALREESPDLETMSVEPVRIAGTQGIRAVYTIDGSGESLLIHEVYVVDGETGFVLTGNAPLSGDTDAAQDLFNQISGSFSFPRG